MCDAISGLLVEIRADEDTHEKRAILHAVLNDLNTYTLNAYLARRFGAP